jgi:hypothetical protein
LTETRGTTAIPPRAFSCWEVTGSTETTTATPEAGTVMSIITADRLAGRKTKETGWQDELYWQVLTGAERDWRALAGATGNGAGFRLLERLWG